MRRCGAGYGIGVQRVAAPGRPAAALELFLVGVRLPPLPARVFLSAESPGNGRSEEHAQEHHIRRSFLGRSEHGQARIGVRLPGEELRLEDGLR